jgi:hypothetical protein
MTADRGQDVIRGSCACGEIAFRPSEPPTMMATCHCGRCRKIGASTFVFVRAETFQWVKGQAEVQRLKAQPPYQYDRCFCRRCGTALGEPGAGASFPINADCLDDDPQVRVRFHEFVAEKPAWRPICDDAVQFAGHPVQAAP